jgi:signal transduction histidine kinase
LPDSAIVFGDRDRLMQLFNNLLENSLRYTDSGGGLHISGKHETGALPSPCGFRTWRAGCTAGKIV